ncbi:MAG TPA: hypothetical protein VGS12_09380 [Caulobacteraceae bacterium]|nr:hypothetical protein [Caulobacteraceae bacterium]
MRKAGFLAAAAVLAALAAAGSVAAHHGPMTPMPAIYQGQADKPGAPVIPGLGAHRHPISTRNPRTQMFFDQGVNLLFGFNHAEAIRSFREAARLDPDCAMCWWGVAFALGPNINLAMPDDAVAPAWQALQHAVVLEPKATPEERGWIEALRARYAEHPPADRSGLDEAFAQAMGRLWRAHPQDLDAGVFYAEAMMDTQPWDFWAADGKTPKKHAGEIVSVLEYVIRRAPEHPGALHLYIHAVEGSSTPERAETAADRLETLMPGAGHIVHMPSHIYYRVGRYADSIKVNEAAAKADETYIAACRAQGFYPAGYYGHNIHFLWASAEMEGRSGAALDAARRLNRAVDVNALDAAVPFVELYGLAPVATLVRFGRWREVLAEPAPATSETLDRAVWLFAQGFANADLERLDAARADLARLAAIPPADLARYQALPAPQLLAMWKALLAGEIARVSGDLPTAVTRFREAQAIQEALPYTEPPFWHQPVSHLLGAALLEAHRPAEAEAVYRASLKEYRRDGWALFGLAQALEAQGKAAQAAQAQAQFADAWRFADVQLASSRF